MKEENQLIGTLSIQNKDNEITIEFTPKISLLSKYFISYSKETRRFDLEQSTFKLDNTQYLHFFETLGKKVIHQEK